ncbi:Tat pathway signal sequence domain protein [Pseudomonas sp. nanlin1]|uniref:Tat pathway signal sequence domain protein n=1 Tax=Pseudomonas sp. nanlin1 TaxID=3040605 RepID=UPI00388DF78E
MNNAENLNLLAAPLGTDFHRGHGFNQRFVACRRLVFAMSLVGLSTLACAGPQPPACETPPGGIIFITQDCVDPQFDRPVIDRREDVQSPVLTHRVSGHFEGTDVTFSFFFPPKDQWKGRFFHKVYPLGDGSVPDRVIKFAAESGAYTVDTVSPSGYRANAAAAKFSKRVAGQYYGVAASQIHGYIYGGSGGSYLTIAAAENSSGVWQGAVPFVIGVPTSIPTNFFVRAFARLVLEDKAADIADAMRPGGSGNPFAALDPTQASVLAQVTAMGVPLRGWDNYAYLLGLNDPQGLLGFASSVKGIDPGYAEDFWSKPGYLGTEQSALGNLLRRAKVDRVVSVERIDRDLAGKPLRLHVAGLSQIKNSAWLDFTLEGARGDNRTVYGALDAAHGVIMLSAQNPADVLNALENGARVRVDNRWAIALTSYHRHQVPASGEFTVWDQFRNADGSPRYPQRPKEVGPIISAGVSAGASFTGKINSKMIIIANALDVDAYPWDADWYGRRLKAAEGNQYDAKVRVWLNDNADHLDGSVVASGTADNEFVRLIDYNGILEQAVRDVSAWVEEGIAPPRSTKYALNNGQVSLPANASARQGIQPVVKLTSRSGERISAKVGEPVTLLGDISVPASAGKIVKTQWSQTGNDGFLDAPLAHQPSETLAVHKTFIYSKPGTYYPVLRATVQREGDATTEFAQVSNLARVRVVVE